jgi:hypothetical protein
MNRAINRAPPAIGGSRNDFGNAGISFHMSDSCWMIPTFQTNPVLWMESRRVESELRACASVLMSELYIQNRLL